MVHAVSQRAYLSLLHRSPPRRPYVPVYPLFGGVGFGLSGGLLPRVYASPRVRLGCPHKTERVGLTDREGSFGIAAFTAPPPRRRPGSRPSRDDFVRSAWQR